MFPLQLDKLGMRDPGVSREKAGTENLTCVGTGEMSGLRDRVKDLGEGIAMYRQVVDGLVSL